MKVFRGLLIGGAISLVLWALLIVGIMFTLAEANADPACERRSAAHVAEHGGIAADSAYHVAHGQLPTCNPDKQQASRPKDDGKPWKRDELGWHCTWRGCG